MKEYIFLNGNKTELGVELKKSVNELNEFARAEEERYYKYWEYDRKATIVPKPAEDVPMLSDEEATGEQI